MKKYHIIFLFAFKIGVSTGQNCTTNYTTENKYKEIYDYLISHKYYQTFPSNTFTNDWYSAYTYPPNNYTYPNTAAEANLQFLNLDNVGPLLESLIRMYEITHDKAYLIKAINKSIQLIKARGGATAPNSSPYAWASGWNV
jgi:hypothetical protein